MDMEWIHMERNVECELVIAWKGGVLQIPEHPKLWAGCSGFLFS